MEKIVQILLTLMNAVVAVVVGMFGFFLALICILFCDIGPFIHCATIALCSLLVSGSLVVVSALAISAMFRKDDSMLWYLKAYPFAPLIFGGIMFGLRVIPEWDAAWLAFVGLSLLASTYAFWLRKSRQPVPDVV